MPRQGAELSKDVAEIEAGLGELERRYPGQMRYTGGETDSCVPLFRTIHHLRHSKFWSSSAPLPARVHGSRGLTP